MEDQLGIRERIFVSIGRIIYAVLMTVFLLLASAVLALAPSFMLTASINTLYEMIAGTELGVPFLPSWMVVSLLLYFVFFFSATHEEKIKRLQRKLAQRAEKIRSKAR